MTFSIYESKKKVQIVLSENEVHEMNEYLEIIANAPKIPFNKFKKPIKGVLKQRNNIEKQELSSQGLFNFNFCS